MVDHSHVPKTVYERAVLLDTSAVLELERQNREALACLHAIQFKKLPVYITSQVVTETHRRLLFDFGQNAASSFLGLVYSGSSGLNIVRPSEEDESEAIRLIRKYESLKLTLCDALSFAVMLRLGILRAFTYDRNHFWTVGFVVVPPLDI